MWQNCTELFLESYGCRFLENPKPVYLKTKDTEYR